MKNRIGKSIVLLILSFVMLNGCAPSAAAQDEAVLVYKRIGGFAGFRDQFTVYADGRITSQNGRQRTVDPRDVDTLLDEIRNLGFFELTYHKVPKSGCCDQIFFELEVTAGNQSNAVSVQSEDSQVPGELWEVLKRVQQFFE